MDRPHSPHPSWRLSDHCSEAPHSMTLHPQFSDISLSPNEPHDSGDESSSTASSRAHSLRAAAAHDPTEFVEVEDGYYHEQGGEGLVHHYGETQTGGAPQTYAQEPCVGYSYSRELSGAGYAEELDYRNRSSRGYYTGINRYSNDDNVSECHLDVPFTPDLSSVHLSTVRVGDNKCLQANVWLGNKHNVCNFAIDPPTGVVTFVVTRRWSAPGKVMIIGGRSMRFPNHYNWDLGQVLDSGEKTKIWICRWPKIGEQLVGEAERVVDVVVQEGDYWFGLEKGGVKCVDKGKCKAIC